MTGCKSITSCFIITLHDEATIEDTILIRSTEYQEQIDRLLAADAENKKWERIYIKEMEAARKHDDIDAYRFFLDEFLQAPRFILPEWLKKEPGYVPGITAEELENR